MLQGDKPRICPLVFRMTTRMTAAAIEAYLDEVFPQIHHGGRSYFVEAVGPMTARMRCDYHERHLRPGGTVSGPTMMELADFAMYVAVFSAAGPQPLAVTTNLNINFLRKPAAADLIADARLMKVGKRLAVGEVNLYSDGESEPVAHVTSTYSLPVQK